MENQAAEQSTLTSKEDFELFKAEVARWLKFFGLKGWRVRYEHNALAHPGAHVDYAVDDRLAWISLAEDLLQGVTRELLSELAFHEVCELLLARVYDIGASGELPQEQRKKALGEAVHEVIRILENVVWEPPDPPGSGRTLAEIVKEMQSPNAYLQGLFGVDEAEPGGDKTEIGGEW